MHRRNSSYSPWPSHHCLTTTILAPHSHRAVVIEPRHLRRRERFQKKVKKMQLRKNTSSVYGRPSGTDGSDFSYRMVVNSRYTKVAEGKSRLLALIPTQVLIQLIVVLYTFLSTSKEESLHTIAISSSVIGLISFIIGELGRRRSRVNFLKVYIVASSIAYLLSISSVASSFLEVIRDLSRCESKKFELFEIGCVLLGLLVQLITISTVISLIRNMSPPKRAS